jgi:hypothetical protein
MSRPAGNRVAEWAGYQLAIHPRLRRLLSVWLISHLLALWSIAAAPPAFAATMAGALTWTGLTDSYGVPLGSYYLSVISTREAITEAGPDINLNPASWLRWAGNALTTGLTHDATASLLQAQASIYIVIITLSLWLMRFAMSSTWLYWLATWFRPLFDVLRNLLVELSVFPICLTLGLAVGAYHLLWLGRRGSGWGIMLSAFIIGVLGIALTRDPLTGLYSGDGLLNQGRNLGFTVAQAAMANGPIAVGGTQAQLDHLTAHIADATVRMPMQIQNFGAPIDGIGNCADAYTRALLSGRPDGPAHAMAAASDGGCGAPHALAFAQHLDGSNVGIGALFIGLCALFSIFICYVTYSYIMVCGAAFLNAIMALFAVGPAMINGAPRRRALRRLTEFVRHAFLVFVYVVYISFTAVILLKMAAPGGYGAQINMTHPVALLVLLALMSAVAAGLFWWLKRQLGDRTRHDLTQAVTNLTDHIRSGYDRGQRGYERGRDDDRDDPDTPLTGSPVPGRPPGGRGAPGRAQHRPGAAGPASAQIEPTGATTSGAATAAEAGATVVAPEVVAAVAVAGEAQRRIHHQRGADGQPNGQRPSHGAARAARSDDSDPRPDVPSDAAPGRTTSPAAGRLPRRDNRTEEHSEVRTIFDDDDAIDEPPTPGRQ